MRFGSNYRKAVTKRADEKLLATLGYKQEFKREFSPPQVFGLAFRLNLIYPYVIIIWKYGSFYSIMGLLPSIAYVLYACCIWQLISSLNLRSVLLYAIPNGGKPMMTPRWSCACWSYTIRLLKGPSAMVGAKICQITGAIIACFNNYQCRSGDGRLHRFLFCSLAWAWRSSVLPRQRQVVCV